MKPNGYLTKTHDHCKVNLVTININWGKSFVHAANLGGVAIVKSLNVLKSNMQKADTFLIDS